MALNLITKQEYKEYAGIKSTNYDLEIDSIIPRVSQLVKTYCRRTFVDYMDRDKVDIFHGNSKQLMLEETPVVLVSSVEASEDYGQSYTALTKFIDWIPSGDYILPLNAEKYWPEKIQGYRVTYRAGYEDVPDDVALAVMDLVTYYRRSDASIHSNRNIGSNTAQIEYISTNSMPAHIRRVLTLYSANYL